MSEHERGAPGLALQFLTQIAALETGQPHARGGRDQGIGPTEHFEVDVEHNLVERHQRMLE